MVERRSACICACVACWRVSSCSARSASRAASEVKTATDRLNPVNSSTAMSSCAMYACSIAPGARANGPVPATVKRMTATDPAAPCTAVHAGLRRRPAQTLASAGMKASGSVDCTKTMR